MFTRILLTIFFILSSLTYLSSQCINDSKELITRLFQTIDENNLEAFEELILDKKDTINRHDHDCEEALTENLYEIKNRVIYSYSEIREKLMLCEIKASTFKVEEIKQVENHKNKITINVHFTHGKQHGVLRIAGVRVNDCLKIAQKIKLATGSHLLKNIFNHTTDELIQLNCGESHEFNCYRGCQSRRKKGEIADYEYVNYYVDNLLYQSVKFFPRKNIINSNFYYRNGQLKDSSLFEVQTNHLAKKVLKIKSHWDVFPLNRSQSSVIKNVRFNATGVIKSSDSYSKNGEVEQVWYFKSGRIKEETKSIEDSLLYYKWYDQSGRIIKKKRFFNLEKASTQEHLSTFPSFKDIADHYYNIYQYSHPTPRVFVHRQPLGWVVESQNTGEQYTLWSFKTQNYLKLPTSVFRPHKVNRKPMELYNLKLNKEYNQSLHTIFSGYPAAIFDSNELLKNKTTKNFDDLRKMRWNDLDLCIAELKKPDFIPTTHFFNNVVHFYNTSKKMMSNDTSRSRNYTYYYGNSKLLSWMQIRKVPDTTQARLKEFPLSKSDHITTRLKLEECKPNAILFMENFEEITYYQKLHKYRQDVKIIIPSLLKEKEYRNNIEKTFNANIFKGEDDLYSTDLTTLTRLYLYSSKRPRKMSLDNYLGMIRKMDTTNKLTPLLITIDPEINSGIEVEYQDDILKYMGLGGMELLRFLFIEKGVKSIESNSSLSFYWKGRKDFGLWSTNLSLSSHEQEIPKKGTQKLLQTYDSLNYINSDYYKFDAFLNAITYLKKIKNKKEFQTVLKNTTKLYTPFLNKIPVTPTPHSHYLHLIDLVILGLKNKAYEETKELLKVGYVHPCDYCLLLGYYEDEIGKENKRLYDYLKEQKLTTRFSDYYEDN